jgi:hypothetical protein
MAALSSPGFLAVKPCPLQARAKAAKSGFVNSMPLRNGGRPTLSASSLSNPKAELLKMTTLTGS